MRKLFINSAQMAHRGLTPGDFALVTFKKGEPPKPAIEIGNYIEVVLHRKLGVTGELKTPAGPQAIRSYELVVHHSAIHGIEPPEMVRFDCPAKTVDFLLKNALEGGIFNLRPVLVTRTSKTGKWKWYVLAVNGVYHWGQPQMVPHSTVKSV